MASWAKDDHVHRPAYITVMFALVFLTVLSVVLSALEAIRISAVRLEAEVACAVACDAFLSQFHPQVQARYGLYLVERDGYDTAFFRQFIENNCGWYGESPGSGWLRPKLEAVAIDGEIHIADEDFRYLEAQIGDYMKVMKGSAYAQEFVNQLLGNVGIDVEGQKDSLTVKLDQTGKKAEADKAALEAEADKEGVEGPEASDEGTGETVEDPREGIGELLKNPILYLVMDGQVSNASLDISALSQNVGAEPDVPQMSGFMEYTDVSEQLQKTQLDFGKQLSAVGDGLLADCYILDYMKNAAQKEKHSGVCFDARGELQETVNVSRSGILGASALAYEVEYILSGHASDSRNLTNIINQISMIRMICNFAYLYQSGTKTAAVRAVSTALASALLMPFLGELFFILILAAWAYGEAIMDCKALLSGRRVPFFKNDHTWQLSLAQLGKISADTVEGGTKDSESGLSYEDYLRLFLLSVPKQKKYTRLLNIIEANIRLESGCGSFSLDRSVLGVEICADFVFYPVFFANPLGETRYEHHVKKAAAY